MVQIGYKIRNKETGEFSGGGTFLVWKKGNGKTWNNIGALKNHLNQFMNDGKLKHDYPYHNAEIIEVEINLDDCFSYEVDGLIEKMQESKKAQNAHREAMQAKWQMERELRLLEELKNKYESKS